jgi:hypothetical protein
MIIETNTNCSASCGTMSKLREAMSLLRLNHLNLKAVRG